MSTSAKIYPTLRYRDARAAIDWLSCAFGFEPGLVVPGEQRSQVAHAELHLGEATIMLGSELDPAKDPLGLGGRTGKTSTYAAIDEDIDAHCQRARAAGAEIIREPADMDYGSREYSARDLEGNVWSWGTYRP